MTARCIQNMNTGAGTYAMRLLITVLVIAVTCSRPPGAGTPMVVDGFQCLGRPQAPSLVRLPRLRTESSTHHPGGQYSGSSTTPKPLFINRNSRHIQDDKGIIGDGNTTFGWKKRRPSQHLTRRIHPIAPPPASRHVDRFVYFGTNDESGSSSSSSSSSSKHGDFFASVADPYGWMRDDSRSSLAVLEHIAMENSYTQNSTRHLADVQEALQLEYHQLSSMDASADAKVDVDATSIYIKDEFVYYTRRVSDQPYGIHCRAIQLSSTNVLDDENDDVDRRSFAIDFQTEKILLDENVLFKDLIDTTSVETADHEDVPKYFAMHSVVPSPSNGKIAYSVDITGAELYAIYVMDLDRGSITLVDSTTSGTLVWGATDDTLYYVRFDSAMLRPSQWMEWTTPTERDRTMGECNHRMLLEEPDDGLWCYVRKSNDGRYILWICESSSNHGRRKISVLDLSSKVESALSATSTNDPSDSKATTSTVTSHGSWYDVEHSHGMWWMLSDDGDQPYPSLFTKSDHSNIHNNRCDDWTLVDWTKNCGNSLEDKETLSIEGIYAFAGHLVLQGRYDSLPSVWILKLAADSSPDSVVLDVTRLDFNDEMAHWVAVGKNQEYDSSHVIIHYESMVSPPQVLVVDLDDPTWRHVLYRKHVNGYEQELYGCDRRDVLSRDGITRIPISVVYRRDAFETTRSRPRSGRPLPLPVHLFAYGAYGHSLEASFSMVRLPLLNRGVVCVVAHVRGGGEKGRRWHEAGRSKNKRTSIHDLVDVARWLVKMGWTTPSRMVCEARSAGGLLVAAAVNEDPSLFRAAVLGVPFLDPLCTMADRTLPLTTIERDEWGDPLDPVQFENIRLWSPMQNVNIEGSAKSYPNLLLMGGLHDRRVPYWEPLKYAAMVRHAITANGTKREQKGSPLCHVYVRIETDAGHSFGGDRHRYFQRMSFLYAFVLDQIGTTRPLLLGLGHGHWAVNSVSR